MLVLSVSNNQNLTGFLPEFNKTSSFRELELDSTNFSGNLPVSIGNLKSLTKLKLRECYFSGSIPTSIGNLTQLTELSLSSNIFNKSGKLTWLDKLTKLTLLDLDDCNLYGDIPSSLLNLTQLTFLSLKSNNLTGEIPSWQTNMTQLSEMDLSDNKLTGPIPSSFTQLKNLKSLHLGGNNLVGTVEVFLSLGKLTDLDLSFNKIALLDHYHINFTHPNLEVLRLTGCNLRKIPYFLMFQNNLVALFLEKNNMHGRIPHWIWNASDHLQAIDLSANFLTSMEHNPTVLSSGSLQVINLSHNMLQGNLPVPPGNTMIYDVSNNRLSGDIPPMICSGMSLLLLDLSYNNMSGPIPPCTTLAQLILQGNNFSGTIPQVYPEKCELRVMDLSQNQFKGKVPQSLSNCKMLNFLDLSDNQMEQTFPIWLGTLPLLQVLLLHSNKFHGTIGSRGSRLQFPRLHIIDLSCNSFTGDLPVEYIQIWNAMKVFRPTMELYINSFAMLATPNFVWTSTPQSSIFLTNKGVKTKYDKIPNIFTAIDLSSNKFTGQIPESFGSLEALQLLDLSNNQLTGPISPSLGNLKQLESLDLSHNKLSGIIPQQLASQLNFLAFFNVSYNLLSGPIPQGKQFETFNNNSYVANSGLCGFPLSKNCRSVQSFPFDGNEKYEDDSDDIVEFTSGFDWIFILAGTGSGLVVGFIAGNILTGRYSWLIGWIIHSFGRKQKNQGRRTMQIIRN